MCSTQSSRKLLVFLTIIWETVSFGNAVFAKILELFLLALLDTEMKLLCKCHG